MTMMNRCDHRALGQGKRFAQTAEYALLREMVERLGASGEGLIEALESLERPTQLASRALNEMGVETHVATRQRPSRPYWRRERW